MSFRFQICDGSYNLYKFFKMSNQKKSNKKLQIEQTAKDKEEMREMKKLDTTPLKEEIYQLRQQLSYLMYQKTSVESEMVKANERYMKDSFEIEKTIKIQEEELTDLQNNFKLLRNTFEDTRKKNKHYWEADVDLAAKKKNQEKEVINKKIAEMQIKVDYLKEFKTREIQYKSTLTKLKEKVQQNRSQQKRDIEKIVAEHEGLRKELKDNVERQIENIQDLEVTKLEQKMNREQQIKRENDLILEEINLCESQKAILEEEYKLLILENQNGKSQNGTSLLDGQATETYERSLRVIKLENKLNKLKVFLQEEIQRLDKESKNLETQSQNSNKELQNRIIKTESWLKLKQKDFKKMKACSQMVLNQRSNLEAYLLEVFHEHSELDYKDSANINQILRLLFIKINSKKPPTSYKDYLLSTEQSQLSKQSV